MAEPMKNYKVKAYIRTGPHYNPGFFIQACSPGKITQHFFQQEPGPFVRAIIARAHGVENDSVFLAWL
jgi:hypothetical protein